MLIAWINRLLLRQLGDNKNATRWRVAFVNAGRSAVS
jgi:hypothetical protein